MSWIYTIHPNTGALDLPSRIAGLSGNPVSIAITGQGSLF